jgi:hypothetical protein
MHGLTDLDDLVGQCRAETSRAYIAEALAAYRVGAYRSCIVSTWVAIVFDILGKFSKLSEECDSNAEAEIAKFEALRQNQDIRAAQNYESEILKIIESAPFQLVNKMERVSLERIRNDRHKCAHPTFIAEGEIFQPSAELARLHLKSSVDILMSRPPLQGKRALTKLQNLVISNHFPVQVPEAETELRNSALVSARDSLIRNFVISCIKVCLRDDTTELYYRKLITALEATRRIHHAKVHSILKTDGARLLTPDSDEEGALVVQLLADVQWLEEYLSQVALERSRRMIVDKDNAWRFQNVPNALRVESLRPAGCEALSTMGLGEFLGVADEIPSTMALEKTLALLTESRSYNETSGYVRLLNEYQEEILPDHLDSVLDAFLENSQVTCAFDMIAFVNDFVQKHPEIALKVLNKLNASVLLIESDSSRTAQKFRQTVSTLSDA